MFGFRKGIRQEGVSEPGWDTTEVSRAKNSRRHLQNDNNNEKKKVGQGKTVACITGGKCRPCVPRTPAQVLAVGVGDVARSHLPQDADPSLLGGQWKTEGFTCWKNTVTLEY